MPRRALFRDRARCATSLLEYRCPELLHYLNKASQLPTFDFWATFSLIRRFARDAGGGGLKTHRGEPEEQQNDYKTAREPRCFGDTGLYLGARALSAMRAGSPAFTENTNANSGLIPRI